MARYSAIEAMVWEVYFTLLRETLNYNSHERLRLCTILRESKIGRTNGSLMQIQLNKWERNITLCLPNPWTPNETKERWKAESNEVRPNNHNNKGSPRVWIHCEQQRSQVPLVVWKMWWGICRFESQQNHKHTGWLCSILSPNIVQTSTETNDNVKQTSEKGFTPKSLNSTVKVFWT